MISIRKNPNFTKWYQVFAFGKLLEEFERRSKAIRHAEDLAVCHNQIVINVEGLAQEVRNGR